MEAEPRLQHNRKVTRGMFSDHLKTCEYCRNEYYNKISKPTISVKSGSSYGKRKKLFELGAIIKWISYPNLEPLFQTKGASEVARKPGPIERLKLRNLVRWLEVKR